jgi:hypothetical protein
MNPPPLSEKDYLAAIIAKLGDVMGGYWTFSAFCS